MKNTWLALSLWMTIQALAVSPGWNYSETGRSVGLVRQNYAGFYFKLKGANPEDVDVIYGCAASAANYHTIVSMIVTAKARSLPVSLYVDAVTGSPTTVRYLTIDGSVASVSGIRLAQ